MVLPRNAIINCFGAVK